MREIKYRTWQGGRFHYWGFIKSRFGDDYEFHAIADTNVEPLTITEKMERSQQYTGLKDKNGVEIYEGDVTRCEEPSDHSPLYDRYATHFQIEYAYGMFFLRGDTHVLHPFRDYALGSIEVIGNIYENPELVENTK